MLNALLLWQKGKELSKKKKVTTTKKNVILIAVDQRDIKAELSAIQIVNGPVFKKEEKKIGYKYLTFIANPLFVVRIFF